jgi:hypothetical protein
MHQHDTGLRHKCGYEEITMSSMCIKWLANDHVVVLAGYKTLVYPFFFSPLSLLLRKLFSQLLADPQLSQTNQSEIVYSLSSK